MMQSSFHESYKASSGSMTYKLVDNFTCTTPSPKIQTYIYTDTQWWNRTGIADKHSYLENRRMGNTENPQSMAMLKSHWAGIADSPC